MKLKFSFIAFLAAAYHALRGHTVAANTYDAAVEAHETTVRRTNDAAVTARHLLWKKGAGDNTVALCGATDLPLGTIDNTEASTGVGMTVLLLGKGPTKKMVASGAIGAGVLVYAAARANRAQLVANEFEATDKTLSTGERKRIAWRRASAKHPAAFAKSTDAPA